MQPTIFHATSFMPTQRYSALCGFLRRPRPTSFSLTVHMRTVLPCVGGVARSHTRVTLHLSFSELVVNVKEISSMMHNSGSLRICVAAAHPACPNTLSRSLVRCGPSYSPLCSAVFLFYLITRTLHFPPNPSTIGSSFNTAAWGDGTRDEPIGTK